MHNHSTYSDGLLSPTELIELAARTGADAIALTDHDTMDGLAEAQTAAKRTGIGFVPGVEISVSWGDTTLHVVGLQVDPSAPEYMDAARPGMLLNTATGDLYPGNPGVEAVVCARDYHYGAWVARDSGGGFRGMLRPEDPIVARLKAQHGKFKKLPYVMDGEAVDLVETIQLYLIYAGEDLNEFNGQRAIASFASTALPVAQQYITKHNSWRYQSAGKTVIAPIYQYKWRFSLVPQQNNLGSWFNWKIDLLPPGAKPIDALIKRTDPLYAEAEAFYNQFRSGQVKADYSETGAQQDAEIPF